MSLHKSKGLTAELVILVGCVEGAIPRIDPDAIPDEQRATKEEQRRLFYVAITRPTKMLVFRVSPRSPAAMPPNADSAYLREKFDWWNHRIDVYPGTRTSLSSCGRGRMVAQDYD